MRFGKQCASFSGIGGWSPASLAISVLSGWLIGARVYLGNSELFPQGVDCLHWAAWFMPVCPWVCIKPKEWNSYNKAGLSSDNLEWENKSKRHKWTVSVLESLCLPRAMTGLPGCRNPDWTPDPVRGAVCCVGLEWFFYFLFFWSVQQDKVSCRKALFVSYFLPIIVKCSLILLFQGQVSTSKRLPDFCACDFLPTVKTTDDSH